MNSTPKTALTGLYEAEARRSIEWLRSSSGLNGQILDAGLGALDRKRERLGGTLLGEVFPLMLSDCLVLSPDQRLRLSAAWLSIYSYIEIADRSCDADEPLAPLAFLAASNMLAFGIAEFASYGNADETRRILNSNINASFAGQLNDVIAAKLGGDRRASDTDKNRPIMIATLGFCLAAKQNPERYLAFVESMLPVFQFLDDLQDVQEDWKSRNLTQIVQLCAEGLNSLPDNATEMTTYRTILGSGHVGRQLHFAIRAIESAMLYLDVASDGPLISYFGILLAHLRDLQCACDSHCQQPGSISEEELFRRVKLVASSS